jgi:glycosyltransferase involved in cell wall biosynthesis
MPVYNGGKYLRPAIDSVLAQSFRDFELIIVNDGSTDDTQAIIESYQDPRIVAVVQKNQGVARSLNNGLAIAKGKYVRRHDADDTSTPDAFLPQVDFMESQPDYIMVSNQVAFMSSRGKIAWKYRMPHNNYFGNQPYRDLSIDDFRPDNSSPVIHATVCYRLKDVLELGGYRTQFIVSEDNDLWIRMVEKFRIAVLNRCNYFVRLHGHSATQVHAGKVSHFRRLLYEYSEERRRTGTDPIMRGEAVPPPPGPTAAAPVKPTKKGKHVREDLGYVYGLMVNAGDWNQVRKIGGEILRDGWKCRGTWRLLLFPLLGDRIIKTGVAFKSGFRSKST